MMGLLVQLVIAARAAEVLQNSTIALKDPSEKVDNLVKAKSCPWGWRRFFTVSVA